MKRTGKLLQRFWSDESGISTVEYALLLAFVGSGIIMGAESLSTAVVGQLEAAADCIDGTTVAANC